MKEMKRKPGYFYGPNCSFDSNAVAAYSYGWWQFVKVIKGQVVFNNYNYSNTTQKHQRKVHRQMHECGIKVDRTVCMKRGLQGISSLRELNRSQKEADRLLAEEIELKRVRRNEKAAFRRAQLKRAAQAKDAGQGTLDVCVHNECDTRCERPTLQLVRTEGA